MALIELNVEKPALKREEFLGSAEETDEGKTTSISIGSGEDEAETESESEYEMESESAESRAEPRRLGRLYRIVGGLAVAGVGAVTLKKLRGRRKRGDEAE